MRVHRDSPLASIHFCTFVKTVTSNLAQIWDCYLRMKSCVIKTTAFNKVKVRTHGELAVYVCGVRSRVQVWRRLGLGYSPGFCKKYEEIYEWSINMERDAFLLKLPKKMVHAFSTGNQSKSRSAREVLSASRKSRKIRVGVRTTNDHKKFDNHQSIFFLRSNWSPHAPL